MYSLTDSFIIPGIVALTFCMLLFLLIVRRISKADEERLQQQHEHHVHHQQQQQQQLFLEAAMEHVHVREGGGNSELGQSRSEQASISSLLYIQ